MLFGGVIPIAVYCCPALAAMLLVPIDCECGTKYGLTAYAAVAVLSVLLVADKETAAVFVFLGYYPVVKKFFDRIRPKSCFADSLKTFCSTFPQSFFTFF